jgi:uncharacterized membrane protein YhhN
MWKGGGVGKAKVTAAFVAVAAADVALAASGRQKWRRVTKPLLMPTLMLGRDRATQRALALGGAGDVALLGESEGAFTAGLAAFLGGHIAWIQALRKRGGAGLVRRHPALAIPYALAAIGLNAYLWPHTGRDRYPVIAYSAALAAMAVAALDSGRPVTAAGGALFLTTDTLLALEKFAGVQLPRHEGWVMATYVAAQGLLAA